VFYWFSILFSVDGWVDEMDGLGVWLDGMEGGRAEQRDRQVGGGWVGR